MTISRYFELSTDTKKSDLQGVGRDQIIYLNPGNHLSRKQKSHIFDLIKSIPEHIHSIEPDPSCNASYFSAVKPNIKNMMLSKDVKDYHVLEAPGTIEKLYLIEGVSFNSIMSIKDRVNMQHIVYDGLVGLDIVEFLAKQGHIQSQAVYVAENAMILAGYFNFGVKSVEVDQATTIDAAKCMLEHFDLDTVFIKDNTLAPVSDYLTKNHRKCVSLMNGINQSDCMQMAEHDWKEDLKSNKRVASDALATLSIFTRTNNPVENRPREAAESEENKIKLPPFKRAKFRTAGI